MTDTSKELPELLPCPFCGEDAGDTYYQLGWFISCKHCSASTEVTNAKARAVEAWNRRTPALPVPQFNHPAKRKLNILLGAGEEITGYAFQNKDGRRGSIDCHGFVAWWQDAAAPQPPEAAPVQLPGPVAFALEWTFDGEERGIRLYDDERHCRFDAESDGGVCSPLYTEQQVRQLLADQQFKLDELAMLTRMVVHAFRQVAPDNKTAAKAVDYLKRKGLAGNPLRAAQEQST